MLGNNKQSVKIKRIFVPLTREGQTNTLTGRYYFPENPELEKKIIVGIECHLANPGADISINNFPKTSTTTPFEENVNSGQADMLYLTLFDENNNEKISNFPIVPLWNYANKIKRIHPITGKISTRKSFIEYMSVRPGNPQITLGLSITFYYNQ
jgi:hypothetical protein